MVTVGSGGKHFLYMKTVDMSLILRFVLKVSLPELAVGPTVWL